MTTGTGSTTSIKGPRNWTLKRDEKGHRTYNITYFVKCAITDGPGNALLTPGLPQVGDTWNIADEYDPWAWCRPEVSVTPSLRNEPNKSFEIEFTFSTKPIDFCSDDAIENPVARPPKISGSFTKNKIEATLDRFGNPIVNSAHEQIKGPPIEFDESIPSVKIIQYVADLQFVLLCQAANCVNALPLWGLQPRMIKMLPPTWERRFYSNCQIYYERTLEFEANFATFDRDVLDTGTKVLHGHWNKLTGAWVLDNVGGVAADFTNPTHFDRFTDKHGNPCQVVLDGLGKPSDVPIQRNTGTDSASFTVSAGKNHVEYYKEFDFTLLGIPTTF